MLAYLKTGERNPSLAQMAFPRENSQTPGNMLVSARSKLCELEIEVLVLTAHHPSRILDGNWSEGAT
jgi:hypothetical protein